MEGRKRKGGKWKVSKKKKTNLSNLPTKKGLTSILNAPTTRGKREGGKRGNSRGGGGERVFA